VKQILQFIHESKEEFKKVTWPDKDEVANFTIVVIITIVFMSLFLWAVDSGLMSIVKLLIE
jgi:preprotein translocase subunit SecE